MAQAMHGGAVLSLPSDLDVLVPSPKAAARVLVATGRFKMVHEGLMVAKVQHKATGVEVDLPQMEDFGMSQAGTEQLQGVNVLDLYETLLGLLLRPQKRKKDQTSFMSLIVQRGDELDEEQKKNLAKQAGAPSWQALYDRMFEIYRQGVMEK